MTPQADRTGRGPADGGWGRRGWSPRTVAVVVALVVVLLAVVVGTGRGGPAGGGGSGGFGVTGGPRATVVAPATHGPSQHASSRHGSTRPGGSQFGGPSDRGPAPSASAEVAVADLPPQARHTLDLIARGGPFPHERDGIVFHNRSRRLPARPDGWYREYTVETPGSPDRGPRRIVTGRDGAAYWTADHYRTFARIVS